MIRSALRGSVCAVALAAVACGSSDGDTGAKNSGGDGPGSGGAVGTGGSVATGGAGGAGGSPPVTGGAGGADADAGLPPPACDISECELGEACDGDACRDLSEGRSFGEDLVLDDTYSTHPELAVSPAGHAAVVWTDGGGETGAIRVRRFDPVTGTWSAPQDVQAPGAPFPGSPDVGVDDAGNVIAIWHQGGNPARDAWVNRYDAATGQWEGARIIEPAGDGFSDEPSIVLDPAGNAIAVWGHYGDTVGNVQANVYDVTTGDWSGVIDLSDPVQSGNGNVSVARDRRGNAFVVWTEADGSRWSTVAARYDAGSRAFEPPVPIGESEPGSTNHPHAAADGAGNFFVLWHQVDDGVSHVWSARWDASTRAWGPATRRDEATGSNGATMGYAAADDRGNALAVWMESTGIASALYDAATSSWVALPSPAVQTGTYDARVAVDRGGNGIAVWRRSSRVFASRFDPVTRAWSDEEPIDPTYGDRSHDPRIAIDDQGRAIVAWYEIDQPANEWNIVVNRFE